MYVCGDSVCSGLAYMCVEILCRSGLTCMCVEILCRSGLACMCVCVETAINKATNRVKDGCNNTKPQDIVAEMSVKRSITKINEFKLITAGGEG